MEQQLTTRKEKQPLRNQAEQSARLVDHLLRWRYLLAAVIFILLVAFKVHGSSLNMWDAYVSEYADGQKSSLIAGEPEVFARMNGSFKPHLASHKHKQV